MIRFLQYSVVCALFVALLVFVNHGWELFHTEVRHGCSPLCGCAAELGCICTEKAECECDDCSCRAPCCKERK